VNLFLGLWLICAAAAAESWGLVPEPADVADQYRVHATEQGKVGASTELVCSPWFDGVSTCLTLIDQNRWRYATRADLSRTGLSESLARTEARGSLKQATKGFETQIIPGMDGKYWARNENDGREGLLLIAPAALRSVTQAPVVVAVPVQGAMIAWVAGHPARDEILSIGVTRMNEESNHPVSDRIYRFDGERWRVWGQAVKPKADD
jgi:hypothetical protein